MVIVVIVTNSSHSDIVACSQLRCNAGWQRGNEWRVGLPVHTQRVWQLILKLGVLYSLVACISNNFHYHHITDKKIR